MLKGKTGTYILLTLVALLWGVLIYKFASDITDDPLTPQKLEVGEFKAPKASTKEPIILHPVERDPFLGTYYTPKSNSKKNEKSKPKDIDTAWPQIKYKGRVKGERKSSYVIQINNQDYIMERGETINDVTLVRASSTSVSIKFKKSTKKFEL